MLRGRSSGYRKLARTHSNCSEDTFDLDFIQTPKDTILQKSMDKRGSITVPGIVRRTVVCLGTSAEALDCVSLAFQLAGMAHTVADRPRLSRHVLLSVQHAGGMFSWAVTL